MLSYRITSHELPQKLNKRQRRALRRDNPDFQKALFDRIISKNRLKAGDRVRVVNSKDRGTVVEIIYDIKDVKWEGNHPHFIVIALDSGETKIATSYQLTRKNV